MSSEEHVSELIYRVMGWTTRSVLFCLCGILEAHQFEPRTLTEDVLRAVVARIDWGEAALGSSPLTTGRWLGVYSTCNLRHTAGLIKKMEKKWREESSRGSRSDPASRRRAPYSFRR